MRILHYKSIIQNYSLVSLGGAALELQVDGTVLQVAAAAILISRGLLFIATGLVRIQTSMILEVT